MRKIISVDFVDVENRFLLANCIPFPYIYDTVTSTLVIFNATYNATSIWMDQNSSQLIAKLSSSFSIFGMNGTVNGSIIFGHYYSEPSPPSSSSSFSYSLNLSAWQN
jgi:hypothetical protein